MAPAIFRVGSGKLSHLLLPLVKTLVMTDLPGSPRITSHPKILDHLCKVPFLVGGNVFTGLREEAVDVFGAAAMLAAYHRHLTQSAVADTELMSARQEALGAQPEHSRPGLLSLGLPLDCRLLEGR